MCAAQLPWLNGSYLVQTSEVLSGETDFESLTSCNDSVGIVMYIKSWAECKSVTTYCTHVKVPYNTYRLPHSGLKEDMLLLRPTFTTYTQVAGLQMAIWWQTEIFDYRQSYCCNLELIVAQNTKIPHVLWNSEFYYCFHIVHIPCE